MMLFDTGVRVSQTFPYITQTHQQMQHCNSVAEFTQVESNMSNVFGKRIRSHCDETCMGKTFVYCSVDTLFALHLLTKKGRHSTTLYIQEFDAANLVQY